MYFQQHLIWILRRDLDNHEYRRHLGRSKVLQTDLVYMLPEYIKDDEYADVLIRLLVILTNPTLLLYRDGPPKDNHGRKVYLELIDILQGYKNAFTREEIWSALFGKLQTALEIVIIIYFLNILLIKYNNICFIKRIGQFEVKSKDYLSKEFWY